MLILLICIFGMCENIFELTCKAFIVFLKNEGKILNFSHSFLNVFTKIIHQNSTICHENSNFLCCIIIYYII